MTGPPLQEVIPLLKENLEKECDAEMIMAICDRIVNMVVEQEQDQVREGVVCGCGTGRG